MTKQNKHLEIFHNIFNEEKYKLYPGKIEYRAISNLEQSIAQAKRIIKHNNLQLRVVSTGQLASFKAFEVHEGAEQEAAAA